MKYFLIVVGVAVGFTVSVFVAFLALVVIIKIGTLVFDFFGL